jgi:hypothetical protein
VSLRAASIIDQKKRPPAPKSHQRRFLSHGGLSSIWPHSRAIVSTMRIIWIIFVLAVITIAGEIYADAVMTSSLIAPAAPDPATVAVGHATTG